MYHRAVNPELIEDILAFEPAVLGVSAATVAFPAAMSLARMVLERAGERRPGSRITTVLGGWHATGCAVSFLAGHEDWSLQEILNPSSPFDYAIAGEGELLNHRQA